MAMDCSEETREEGEAERLPSASRGGLRVKSLKNSHEQVKSLIRYQGNEENLMADVYTWLSDQGIEPVDETFFLQLQEASCYQGLVLLGYFNHPDICWESSTVSCRRSRRLLECTEDNFLSQERQFKIPFRWPMNTGAIFFITTRCHLYDSWMNNKGYYDRKPATVCEEFI